MHNPLNAGGFRAVVKPQANRHKRTESEMSPQMIFGTSVAFGLIGWSIVTAQYLWPALRGQTRADALRPLLMLHGFRFVGLSFLVTGVVSSEDLSADWARPAAYGDLIAAVLALLALAALPSRLGIALAWIFNVWGLADLLYAFYQGNHIGLEPGQLGAAYFHCDRLRAAAPHHARAVVPPPLTRRRYRP